MREDPTAEFDLIIAGAGMVGMSTALWAQMQGLRVALCDPAAAGSGASYGNAATIATYGSLPVNSPEIFRSLPYLLLHRDSPLRLDLLYALTHPRWMLSFLANCRARKVAQISDALAALLSIADAGLNPLISEAGAEDLIVANDCLYIWSSPSGYAGAQDGMETQRRQGIPFEIISGEDARGLEPALAFTPYRAKRYIGARHLRDPQAFITRLQMRFLALGGTWISRKVLAIAPDATGVTATLTGQEQIRAARFVNAAGAHARSIKGSAAKRMPLDVERGYHVMFRNHAGLTSRPIGWAEAGFYATSLDQGLRAAGTVEIAGLSPKINARRIAYIQRRTTALFGPLDGPTESWLGFRPTFPDALPAIGFSPKSNREILAFGHQHLGLTLGGITGRIVTDLAQGRQPNLPLAAYDPQRFL